MGGDRKTDGNMGSSSGVQAGAAYAVKGDKDTCASGISCLRRPIDRSACRHEWTGSTKHGAQVGQKAPVLLSQSYPAAGLAY